VVLVNSWCCRESRDEFDRRHDVGGAVVRNEDSLLCDFVILKERIATLPGEIADEVIVVNFRGGLCVDPWVEFEVITDSTDELASVF